MVKKKSKKKRKNKLKTSIQEIEESRTGGKTALAGYSYQFLYSCFLILSETDEKTIYKLEGIEDIDKIEYIDKKEYKDDACLATHIQLKYSRQRQDASFFKKILKNFLEVYLIDSNRNFKLVYDFEVSKGHFSKLIHGNLDNTSNNYWKKKIEEIKQANLSWDWKGFNYETFISKLSFKRIKKDDLSLEIEKLLISNYEIITDNISLYANGVKVLCFKKMEDGDIVRKEDITSLFSSIQDDIDKGSKNPAYKFIRKINFTQKINKNIDLSYYEGKKPTFIDIANQLPVRRPKLEKEIINSVEENRVTVIKASSGQGKTTLAYQAAYDLRKEYTIYQISWCNDSKELSNIVSFFETRVKLGEKPLIILDNLDIQLSQWNNLAQLFQEQVSYHYKLIVTTREDDWYNYSGDLSNIKALNVVNLFLSDNEAQEIYLVLKEKGKIHESIKDWKKAYKIIKDKKLLIEYIYLLTHGEMLSERIEHQITQLSAESNGKIKCEILRKVCFADICGVKLLAKKLIENISDRLSQDPGEILRSLENEYLIQFKTYDNYIEGLHPVRSHHIVQRLHQYIDVEDTALEIIKIIEPMYQSKFYSFIPNLINKKDEFYIKLVKIIWDQDDLSPYLAALQGVFSGSVMQYYKDNKHIYDDANEHGGLFLLDRELNPFTNFEEIDESVSTLDNIKETMPDNKNIDYLINLRNSTPKIKINNTDIYLLSEAIFEYFEGNDIFRFTTDIDSYAKIIYWLLKIEPSFNLSKNVSLKELWSNCSAYQLDIISIIMYSSWLGNRDYYLSYVNDNVEEILIYLRNKTESLEITVDKNVNSIYVNYILPISEVQRGNEESVKRLKSICKTLPIFDIYCASGIKPSIDLLSQYNVPDDSLKKMPLRNIIIMFNQEFTSLWSKTILSNYESDSVDKWIEYWFNIRQDIITLSNYFIEVINKLLGQKNLRDLPKKIVKLHNRINNKLIREFRYPFQERPFDEKANLPDCLSEIKNNYFQSFNNFSNQLVGFLSRDNDVARLALINLRKVISSLLQMQDYFHRICIEQEILIEEHLNLCVSEEKSFNKLINVCVYYNENKPNKYFNKYQINKWCEKKYQNKIINSKKILNALSSEFYVVFPERYFYEDVLSLYPIILHDFDMTSKNDLLKFLYLSTDFVEMDYDYLIVLLSDTDDKLNPNGFKFPKAIFQKLKEALENDNLQAIDEINPPFPIEVSSQILECFDSKYTIQTIEKSRFEGLDLIGELLWAISISRKILNNNEDQDYLDTIIQKYSERINHLLKEVKQNISSEEHTELLSLCHRVYKGEMFLDDKFNEFFEGLISRNLS